MHVLAVDPGDVHNGAGWFYADRETRTLTRLWTRSWQPDTLYNYLDRDWNIQRLWVVCESFHLYPELARQQGYSTFPTCERIGAVKYICRKRGINLTMQEPSIKRQARRIGERIAPELGAMRMISSARGSYRGWDWTAANQHERDATCHGVWWAFRNLDSPLNDLDLKRQANLEWVA